MSYPRPPRAAAMIGYALVLPFVYGAATEIVMMPGEAEENRLAELFIGYGLLLDYASVLLVFLSGALWGFAARAQAYPFRMHLLAAAPGVYAFLVWGTQDIALLLYLMAAGYAATLAVDLTFVRAGLAPGWWMRLQITMKTAITVSLVVAATI